MSYMRGDLLTKTRKLVKGLAKPAPTWLKAMEESVHSFPTLPSSLISVSPSSVCAFTPAFLYYATHLAAIGIRSTRKPAPPVTFPRVDGKIKKIELPEDVYIKKFFKKHPDSLYHDAIKISGFDPPPARVFAWRILELKEQGVSEDYAMAFEYRKEKKAKKKAYKELKEIARSEGREPPPDPYPSAIKEIQAEEKKYVMDRFCNPKIIEIANKMKEERDMLLQNRAESGQW
ncbi:hypothetical protein HU200_064607 [Digitaria exilis]|uniref:Small ribosomal subunit protein mS23 n=1 Tax=Digitaria exilis TaxID=1010633 RepID=A0A835DU87_9POAL|nr:hypothetical protein HU200_064607 [Digitaria exilis]